MIEEYPPEETSLFEELESALVAPSDSEYRDVQYESRRTSFNNGNTSSTDGSTHTFTVSNDSVIHVSGERDDDD